MNKEREELVAVVLSLALAVAKGMVAFWTGTLSLLASALDSLMDFIMSGLNLLALKVSSREADSDHTYGHEKIEPLAGLLQSIIILASAGYLGYSAIDRLIHPREMEHLLGGIVVIAISMVVSLVVAYRLRRTGAETGSVVLKADSLHYSMDLYTQGGILVAFGLMKLTGWRLLDPIVTFPIVLYIIRESLRIGKESVDELMDRESSPETLKTVQEVLHRHGAQVIGMHNFKTRRAGGKRFVEFHLEVKGGLSFEEVHQTSEQIVREIRGFLPNTRVTIHPDPEGEGADESDL